MRGRLRLHLKSAASDENVIDIDDAIGADDDASFGNNGEESSGASNDDNGEAKKGMRAFVRQRVSYAKQKVQQKVQRVQKLVTGGLASGVSGNISTGKELMTDVMSNVVGRGGSPIVEVLTDAAVNAVGMATEEVRQVRMARMRNILFGDRFSTNAQQREIAQQLALDAATDAVSLSKTHVADAFDVAETALHTLEMQLLERQQPQIVIETFQRQVQIEIQKARQELEEAKREAAIGLGMAEKAVAEARETVVMAAVASKEDSRVAETDDENDAIETIADGPHSTSIAPNQHGIQNKEQPAPLSDFKDVHSDIATVTDSTNDITDTTPTATTTTDLWSEFNISSLRYEDVDYTLTDMAPPFINEDECLVPGEPLVRVEKAPQNSRRIFAGIDIPVGVEDVWAVSHLRIAYVFVWISLNLVELFEWFYYQVPSYQLNNLHITHARQLPTIHHSFFLTTAPHRLRKPPKCRSQPGRQ